MRIGQEMLTLVDQNTYIHTYIHTYKHTYTAFTDVSNRSSAYWN